MKLENYNWGVVATGHALFLASIIDTNWNNITLCDEESKALDFTGK